MDAYLEALILAFLPGFLPGFFLRRLFLLWAALGLWLAVRVPLWREPPLSLLRHSNGRTLPPRTLTANSSAGAPG